MKCKAAADGGAFVDRRLGAGVFSVVARRKPRQGAKLPGKIAVSGKPTAFADLGDWQIPPDQQESGGRDPAPQQVSVGRYLQQALKDALTFARREMDCVRQALQRTGRM